MFQIDTIRLIKKTFSRFFTLVCIVTIGVAFMMGLLATSPILRESVDRYYKNQNLQDIQLYSSYGFCDEDVEKLKELDVIKDVYPSKMVDAYINYQNGTSQVVRCRELESNINKFELIEGRMPEKENEVLIISPSNRLNETIKITLDDEDEIFDYLKINEFKVVGLVKTSEYMAKIKSTSNLNNLDLETIIYIPNSNFIFDYYTTIYVTLNETDNVNSFTTKYENIVSDSFEDIEILKNRQQNYLKETILLDYLKEIEDGEAELEKNRIEGQEKLDDAKKELDDANIKIIYGQMQIDTNKATLESSQKQLNEEKAYLDKIAPEVNEAVKKIEDEDSEGRSFEQIYAEVTGAYTTYISLKASKTENAKDNYGERINDLNNTNQRIQDEVINPNLDIVNDTSGTYTQEEKDLAQSVIDNAQRTINTNNEIISQLESMQNGSYDSTIDSIMNQIDAAANGSIEDTYADMTKLAQAKAQIDAGYIQIEAGQETINQSIKLIEESEKELLDGKKEYENGLNKYKEGVIEFNEKIEDAERKLRQARQDLEELPNASWMILNRDSHYSSLMYENTCNQMEAICIVMPILFFLVAALVCMTTMTRLVDEQRGQIGIFVALGFSKFQVISKYLIYALIASLIGSIVGVVIGMAIFPTVIYTTWRLMYDLPSMHTFLPIGRLIICLLSFIVLMEVVTYYVVNKTLIENPAQLMRPKSPKDAKKVFLEYIPVLWNKLSFTSKITSRNLIRYKTRFFMTVIGVAGCTGLLVLGFGIKDSISDVVNKQFKEVFDYQYTVNLNNDHSIKEITDILESDLENDEVVPYMGYTTKIYLDDSDETILLEVIDARSSSKILGLKDKSTNKDLKLSNKGVIISEKFAKNNGIKKGDIITFESKEGIKQQVKVDAITHMYFQHYMFISEGLYENLFDDNIHYTNIAIRSNNELRQIEEQLIDNEDISSSTDFKSFINQFEIMIQALNFIILVIIFTAGALAFVVLINLTQVNISERIREIATLKVLGFRDIEVNSYIFKEILLLTIIGGIVGLPLGSIELKFVMNVINMDMIMFPTQIKPLSYLLGYSITFIFTAIVLFFTRKQLKSVEMVESLKSVE